MTQHVKLSQKIQRVYEQQSELQQTTKPWLSYHRDHSWGGEPCDQCGTKERAVLQRGRYLVTDGDEALLFRACGICLPFIETWFELSME